MPITAAELANLGVGSVLLDRRYRHVYQSRWCCYQHCRPIWSRPDDRNWYTGPALLQDNPDGFDLLLDQDNTED